MQRFLRHLAERLDDPGPIHRAAGATRFDRAPLFVHHLRSSGLDPDAVLATLTDAPEVLAARVTGQVSSRARTPLAAGVSRATTSAATVPTRPNATQILREFGAHVADAILLERPEAFATEEDVLPTETPRYVEVAA